MTPELTASETLAEQLLSRIELRTARVCVVGLGYVGLPLAETFAWGGFPVVGFDIDPEKVKKLRTGQSYIGHISSERITELVDSGRFEASFNANCFATVDAIIICVPTPLTEAREPDLIHCQHGQGHQQTSAAWATGGAGEYHLPRYDGGPAASDPRRIRAAGRT